MFLLGRGFFCLNCCTCNKMYQLYIQNVYINLNFTPVQKCCFCQNNQSGIVLDIALPQGPGVPKGGLKEVTEGVLEVQWVPGVQVVLDPGSVSQFVAMLLFIKLAPVHVKFRTNAIASQVLDPSQPTPKFYKSTRPSRCPPLLPRNYMNHAHERDIPL